LHGKVAREVRHREEKPKVEERGRRELNGDTMHGNRGGTRSSSRRGKMGPKGVAGINRGSRRGGGARRRASMGCSCGAVVV
jgi:hypothetical protein